jgi:hypothetical protein
MRLFLGKPTATGPSDESMQGSKDLDFLLNNMTPEIVPGEYVFAIVSDEKLEVLSRHSTLVFREKEGITVIIPRELADTELIKYESTWGLITLNVHSDLAAVGFLARITEELKKAGISVNVVSAFYHDHLFVPYTRTSDALAVLNAFSSTKAR